MALSTPVKALALVVFLAGIAGATYVVNNALGDTVEASLVGLAPVRDSTNATPGHNVSYLLTVTNRDSTSRDVRVHVGGAASGASDVTTVRPGANATVFVTVTVPDDLAQGEHAVDVSIESDGRTVRERAGVLRLNVLAPAPGFGPGDSAEAIYTGRLSATGRVFNTNDRALIGLNVPKTDSYRFSDGVLPVVTTPRLSVVVGLAEGMRGMQPGESRTITFPPEQGYGPATQDEVFPRTDVLSRNITLRNDVQMVDRAAFDSYVVESGQGRPETFDVGSRFKLDQDGSLWTYEIVAKSNESVRYKLYAELGDRFTIYPFWTNASVLTAINATHVSFFTTPTTEPGQKITLKAYWPDMSTLVSYNETDIVVRNDPPVGFSFTQVLNGQPREVRIREVGERNIIGVIPSSHPLAGKELTFDITLLSLDKGSSAP